MLTTQNILFITLAVSIAATAVLLCLTLYYLLTVLKDVRKITGSITKPLESVRQFIQGMAKKSEIITTAANVLSQAADEVIKYVKRKKESHESSQEN